MNKVLKNKVVVITGGANGVGKSAAIECARQGAKIVIGDHDENAANKVIKEIIGIGGEALFVKTELRKVIECKNLFDRAYEEYERIDGFFCYAGVTPICPLDDCDEETFDEVMETNFKAAFFCCQQAIMYMRLNNGGSIILTGSAHGWGGHKNRAAYACSKGILRVLNSHIAHQYSAEQIRCNYLILGWTPTEGEIKLRAAQGMTEEELRKEAAEVLPMGRMCETSDYMEAIVYLLSDSSNMMTGSIFRITAGEYI